MRSLLVGSMTLVLLAVPAEAAQQADSKTMTIRLISTTTSLKLVTDRPPKGTASKGDVISARSRLRNAVPQFGRPKNAVVGSDVATLTLRSATLGDLKVQVKLPGGTLRAAGRLRDGPAKQTIRVTGGTGDFANARGTGDVINLNASGDRTLNVYRLQLP